MEAKLWLAYLEHMRIADTPVKAFVMDSLLSNTWMSIISLHAGHVCVTVSFV